MFEKYSHIHSQFLNLPHLVLLLTLMAGIVIGLMISAFVPQTKDKCKIEYISRDEVLALEKARIARSKEQKLFFGRARDAIGLIEKFAKLKSKNGTHVIFIKGFYVRGMNVSSISEEIHSEVVQSLRKGTTNKVKQNDEKEENEESNEGDGGGDDESESKSGDSPAMKLLKQLEESIR